MHDLENNGPDENPGQGANPRQGEENGQPARALPPVLQNWQVIGSAAPEVIDGESTLLGVTVEDAGGAAPTLDPATETARPLTEQIDPVVVLLLHTRRVEVTPGERAEFLAEVINNGATPALFEVAVEGWVDEAWFPDVPVRVMLQPGERKAVGLPAAPPRAAQPRAGEHTVAIVAYAPAYPNQSSRIRATLAIAAYDEYALELLPPTTLASAYFGRKAQGALVLHNLGNRAARFEISGRDRAGDWSFEFATPNAWPTRLGRAEVGVEPGAMQQVTFQIRTSGHPLVGVGTKEIPFRVAARRMEGVEDRQVADGRVACAPLLGPWQLAALASLLVLGLLAMGLAGVGVLVALRQVLTPAAAPAPQPAPAPVIALVLSMDQPVPARPVTDPNLSGAWPVAPESGVAGAAGAPLVLPEQVTAPGEATRGAAESPAGNVVQPDQVTAPGEPTRPAGPAQAAAPIVVRPPEAEPPGSEGAAMPAMTYGQMFREVGQRYDLNWPLLAAIAYVESGLDSLALGDDGTLGLMQIRPATWQEWAPTIPVDDPFDSYGNVVVAAVYLDYLRSVLGKAGYPQQEWMLVAYNWGPDKTLDFLNGGGGWDSLPADVRDYATEVLRVSASIPAN